MGLNLYNCQVQEGEYKDNVPGVVVGAREFHIFMFVSLIDFILLFFNMGRFPFFSNALLLVMTSNIIDRGKLCQNLVPRWWMIFGKCNF